MRSLAAILALAPALALAAGPAVTDGPDARLLLNAPGVVQSGGWSLACLFQSSATCSDSRTVTTTRSTAVPCQGAVRNQNTNPASPQSWTLAGGATIGATGADGYADINVTATSNSGVTFNTVTVASGETWVASCYVEQGTLTDAVLDLYGAGATKTASCKGDTTGCAAVSNCIYDMEARPGQSRIECAYTFSAAGTPKVMLLGYGSTGTIGAAQCQLEKAPSAGDRCDSSVCYGSTSGIWQDIPSNTACIAPGGVAGVESYGAVTNYATNSADFSNASWTKAGSTATAISGGYRIDFGAAGNNLQSATTAAASGETWTVSCYARVASAGPTFNWRPLPSGTPGFSNCTLAPTTSWARYSCSNTTTGAGNANIAILATASSSLELQQCQLEKSSTPGRRCDSGGTATTCGADQHTVSTTGWPTAAGELTLHVRLATAPSTTLETAILRSAGKPETAGMRLDISPTGTLSLYRYAGGAWSTALSSGVLAWTACSPSDTTCAGHRITVRWGGGNATIIRDGVQVASGAFTSPTAHGATASLGSDYGASRWLQGTVSLVSVGEP